MHALDFCMGFTCFAFIAYFLGDAKTSQFDLSGVLF